MGHVKDIQNQPNLQTFPDSTYEIANLAPVAQCEAPVIVINGDPFDGPAGTITKIGGFIGHDLTDHIAHITNPGPPTGDYPITSNTDDVLYITTGIGFRGNVFGDIRITNPNAYILRSANSFARFFASRGDSYIIKGGKCYTNVNLATMQAACPTTFSPLT